MRPASEIPAGEVARLLSSDQDAVPVEWVVGRLHEQRGKIQRFRGMADRIPSKTSGGRLDQRLQILEARITCHPDRLLRSSAKRRGRLHPDTSTSSILSKDRIGNLGNAVMTFISMSNAGKWYRRSPSRTLGS